MPPLAGRRESVTTGDLPQGVTGILWTLPRKQLKNRGFSALWAWHPACV